jgi:hypothetical protein
MPRIRARAIYFSERWYCMVKDLVAFSTSM